MLDTTYFSLFYTLKLVLANCQGYIPLKIDHLCLDAAGLGLHPVPVFSRSLVCACTLGIPTLRCREHVTSLAEMLLTLCKDSICFLGDTLNGCSASIDQRSCTDLIRALLTPTKILLLSLKFGYFFFLRSGIIL